TFPTLRNRALPTLSDASRRSRASRSSASPPPTSFAIRWSGASSTPMKGREVKAPMMLEIALEADEEWDSSSSWVELARKAAQAAIAESAFPQLNESSRHVELSVRLASDEEVRGLNAHWRGKDKPTNVLSFPMAEPYELEQSEE